VLLPVGAVEQHGPHLPLNTDIVIPEDLAIAVAKRTDAIVAQPIAYGYKSQPRTGGGDRFPGTTNLDAATFIHTVRDVIKEFARHGVRKLGIFNGHAENTMFIIEGIDLAMRELRAQGVTDLRIMRNEYWDFAKLETLNKVWPEGFPGWATEHAGVVETALMLHLRPNLVDMAKAPVHPPSHFPPYDMYPTNPDWMPWSGSMCSPARATAAHGAMMFEEYVGEIAAAVKREFATTGATQRRTA
jgi:creatinine amidohydrolase